MKTKFLCLLALIAAMTLIGCAKEESPAPNEQTEQNDPEDNTGTVKFKVNQVSIQGYGKLLEGNEIPAIVPGLFYCNVTASSDLEWTITLYRDEVSYYNKTYKGSKNESVDLVIISLNKRQSGNLWFRRLMKQ